jgi:hypothetical protein
MSLQGFLDWLEEASEENRGFLAKIFSIFKSSFEREKDYVFFALALIAIVVFLGLVFPLAFALSNAGFDALIVFLAGFAILFFQNLQKGTI